MARRPAHILEREIAAALTGHATLPRTATKAQVRRAAIAAYGPQIEVSSSSEVIGRASNPYARDAPRRVTVQVRSTVPPPAYVIVPTRTHEEVRAALAAHEAAKRAWNDGLLLSVDAPTAPEAWARALAHLEEAT